MLAKLRSLLLPLANLKNKATIIRLGLAGLVLGIGGFAVYKGAQQMKPKRPTPKPTQTAANKLKPPADDLDPTRNLSGDSPIGFDSGQSPSAEASADSLYNQGAEQNPATVQTEDLYATNDQGTQVEEGTAGADGIPASPLQGHATSSEQPVEGDGSSMGTAPANRIRRLPTAPGNYRIADETSSEVATQQPMEAGDSGETPGQYDGSGPNVDGSQYADGGTGYATGDPSAAAEGPPEAAEVVTPETASNLRTPQTLPGIGSRRTQPLPSAPEVQPVNTPRMLGGLNAAGAAAPGGTPGDRQFEGTQVPSIAIEKFAPAEIQVGKAATFEVRVRNAGQVAAHDVLVTDQVPQGTRLESTSPEAQLAEDGSLAWQLGEMQPGDEVVLSMQVMPEQEGEIGSVAHVTFAGRATARSVCTRPLLNIEHTAPKQVLIGETVRLGITVNNPGTGAATGVIVEEDVPEGLVHVAGGELEYEIGTLRPNETRQLELQLTADKPGLIENMVTVRGAERPACRVSSQGDEVPKHRCGRAIRSYAACCVLEPGGIARQQERQREPGGRASGDWRTAAAGGREGRSGADSGQRAGGAGGSQVGARVQHCRFERSDRSRNRYELRDSGHEQGNASGDGGRTGRRLSARRGDQSGKCRRPRAGRSQRQWPTGGL
jgi:uncharacterized repeat protein (TIGR01451 family)